jgi:iron complex outermembrane receptor protein
MKRIIYVLGLLFINQNFAYAQEKDSIQIAQRKMIKGYVVDYDNTPLTDAIIKIKGTEYSVRSDAEGTFKLQNMNDFPVILEVNKKGYQKSEVILDEYQPTITIKLNLIEKHIEAVLVTSRRRSEEIQKIPIPITVLTAKK